MSKKPAAAGKSSFDLINPSDFFSHLKIVPGAQVLDLACGAGHYSLEISKLLDARGRIHAVDLWEEGIERLKEVVRKRNISNINPMVADVTRRLPLENASIDVCLMATVLHDLSGGEQDSALREIARVLKPAGILVLVEFKKIDYGPGPPRSIRISEREAEEKISKYGFFKTDQGEIGEFNYLLNFQKTT